MGCLGEIAARVDPPSPLPVVRLRAPWWRRLASWLREPVERVEPRAYCPACQKTHSLDVFDAPRSPTVPASPFIGNGLDAALARLEAKLDAVEADIVAMPIAGPGRKVSK